VTATGDRRLDLAVRLRYAGVESVVVPEPLDAVDRAVQAAAIRDTGHDVDRAPGPAVDFVGNYTAFADLRSRA
jgi:hypothetical protein